MRPKERRETGQTDLFRARLDQIVDPTHALVKLSGAIDWTFLETRFGAVYDDDPGRPPLPTRLMGHPNVISPLDPARSAPLSRCWVGRPLPHPRSGASLSCQALAR